MKYLLSFSLFVLFIGISLFLYLSQKPLCITSKQLQRISIVGQESSFHVFNCSYKKNVIYTDSVNNILAKTERDLNSVSSFFDSYDLKAESFSLNILTDRKGMILRKNDQYYISTDLFKPDENLKNFLFEQALEDSFKKSEGIKESDLKILKFFFRTVFNPKKNYSGENRSVWPLVTYGQDSLNQFINGVLWEAYLDLSLVQRNQLLQFFLKDLRVNKAANNEIAYSLEVLGQVEVASNKNQSLLQLNDKKIILDYVDFLNQLSSHESVKSYLDLVINRLRQHDFNFSKTDQFDYVVLVNKADDIAFLRGINKNSDLKVIFSNENIYFDSNGLFIDEVKRPTKISSIVSDYYIYFDCPGQNHIGLSKVNAERVVSIKTCDVSSVNFGGLRKANIERFVRDNAVLPLVVYYMPAIQDLNLGNLNLGELSDWIKQPIKNNSKLKLIGWQSPDWDEDLKVYRAKATHDVIEFYRF